ncbi:effector-associated constant component EACC1 [Actinoplanes palleronii]|uniref:effector-associated constant component EACC1 n=1 Tax=Actinoplanes palleronii TaxID=113570 RepID=UPI0019416031|nr:hypothetical protein [Actinoplanes palleronii]
MIRITFEINEGADSLCSWLNNDEGAGRATPKPGEPKTGELGLLTEILTVVIGPEGAVTATVSATASALISWIRRRTGNCTVKITRADGSSYEITATNIRLRNADEIRALVADTARFINGDTPTEALPTTPPADGTQR